MLVLSSPSGAGKTTLARRLLALEPQLKLSISVTTRKPRPGDQEARDYYFRDEAEFNRMRDAGEFLEWARVHSNLYGTPRQAVMDALARGEDMLFDIDWQGARQLSESAGADLVRVFVLPPSVAGTVEAPDRRAPPTAPKSSRRAWPKPSTRSAIGPSTTTSSSTPIWSAASRSCTRS